MSLELLEGRELLSGIAVTSAADNGSDSNPSPGSLRAAIVAADADTSIGGYDITFAINAPGVQTIALQAPLKAITRSVLLDGNSQPGYAGSPLIVIDGSSAGVGSNGLTVTSGDGGEIRGLSVVGFTPTSSGSGGNGILLSGPGSHYTITGNDLGLEPDGTTVKGNGSGVVVFSTGNTIGGTIAGARNVISGNSNAGVVLAGATATGTVVEGNFIGTNAAGTGTAGNQYGVVVMAPGTTVAANLISGNIGPMGQTGAGILFEGQASGTLVVGNKIGTNFLGTLALDAAGASFSNTYGIYFGTPGGSTADVIAQETIGGTVAGAANLISGNFTGITGNVTSSLIQGNTIGLNLAGTTVIPNYDGIFLGAISSTIGGVTPAARNVVAGSLILPKTPLTGFGMSLSGASDVVEGNFVGLASNGLVATGTGNAAGGMVLNLISSVIGGSTAGAGNIVSNNAGDAIDLLGSGGDAVFGNVIGVDFNLAAAPNTGNGINVFVAASSATPPASIPINDTIGGLIAGAGNYIAHGGGAGIILNDSNTAGVTGLGIRGNTIFGNAKLGIDLEATGVPTPSTLFLNGFNQANGKVTLTGVYSGAPSTTVSIDVFANAADPSGYGQGPLYLGTVSATTNGSGFAVINPTFSANGIASPASFSATATGSDGNTSEFSSNFPTVATASQADLAVLASASTTTVIVNGTVTITESVVNTGPGTANDAVLYDSLPLSLANLMVTSSVGIASVDNNNVVTANFGALPSGTFATVTITGTFSSAGTFVDQPGVSSTTFDPNYANNTAAQTFTVLPSSSPSVDLAVAQSSSPSSGVANTPLTYTIVVANGGPGAATNATVVDQLPASGVTLVSVSASQSISSSIVGNLLTVNLGNLAFGASATITVVVTPTVAGTITNFAGVSGSQYDPTLANNRSTLTTTVAAVPSILLHLAQSPTSTTGVPGQGQGFILTFENFGTTAATNVILNDALPTNMATYAYAIPSQGSITSLANGLLSVNFGTLAPGAIATLQLALIPKVAGLLTNFAGVFTPDAPTVAPSYASASVPIVNGPSVTALNSFGGNAELVIGFNEALNPTSAINLANFQLVALGKNGTGSPQTIKIASITYNQVSHSVMILPAQALDPAQYYKITVIGSTSSGVSDTLGRRLASSLYAAPGGNYSAVFFAGTLPPI